jgi:hypothetical protein
VLGALYLLACEVFWDDPLARFKGVQELAGRHGWSQADFPLRRVTVAPAGFFLDEYGIVAVLALASLLVIPRRLPFWAAYTLSTTAFFWLGPTGLRGYEPLPLVWREALPILPGLMALASVALASLYELPNRRLRVPGRILCVALIVVAASPVWSVLQYRGDVVHPEVEAMRVVREEVDGDADRSFLLACSDRASPEFLAFYFGFEYPANLTVAALGALDRRRLEESDKAFVFVNRQRSEKLKKLYGDAHYDLELAALKLNPRLHGSGVFLFETSDASKLLPALRRTSGPGHGGVPPPTPRRGAPEAASP